MSTGLTTFQFVTQKKWGQCGDKIGWETKKDLAVSS